MQRLRPGKAGEAAGAGAAVASVASAAYCSGGWRKKAGNSQGFDGYGPLAGGRRGDTAI
jgi:hypothetical protein